MKLSALAVLPLSLALLAGCGGGPDPSGQLLEHTHFADHGNYDVLGYANAVCSDLKKQHAATKQDLDVEILALSNNGWTVDDAIREANAAVTILCPKYAALKHS